MDLAEYTTELQALVIRSVLEWVYESARGTLVIIPEAAALTCARIQCRRVERRE
jgi:hypothetical protein